MKTKFKSPTALLLCSVLLAASLFAPAQKAAKAPPVTGIAKASIVFLGPKPPKRYEKKDGKMIMLAPSPGEIPPQTLFYQTIEKKKTVWKSLTIPSNTRPLAFDLPAPTALALYKEPFKPSIDKAPAPFLKFPSVEPGGQYFLVILPREQGANAWSKAPFTAAIDLKSKEYARADCLLINYSGKDLQTLFGTKEKTIPTGEKIIYRRVAKGKNIRVASKYEGRKMWIFNRSLKASKEKISLIIFYDANPKTNAGRDVGALFTEIDRS